MASASGRARPRIAMSRSRRTSTGPATGALPAAILPGSATFSPAGGGSRRAAGAAERQRALVFVHPGHGVAMPAPRFVALLPADHDHRRIPRGGLAVDQALVAAGEVA